MTQKQIDIIIPSFRLDEEYLLPLIHLPKPIDWKFHYYIIVDNPSINVPDSIKELSENGFINLYINPENLGASASRNKGIDAGNSEWILFLDDDVVAEENLLFVYTEAIKESPDEIGFIGVTDFPQPMSKFTQALDSAYLTGIFKIAKTKDRFSWGVTANMMYNRSSMQELRFSQLFPKNGGGEDVDLPMRICMRHNKEFKCLKEAIVIHPWWNKGKPHYERFIRYGIGNAYLLTLYKKLSWYDFPNTVESLLILIVSTPLFIVFGHWSIWLTILLAIPIFEYIVVYIKERSKGIRSFKTAYYVTLLKSSLDYGVLKTILKERKLNFLMRRAYVGFPKSNNFHLNKQKIIKLSLFIILFIYFIITI